MKIHVYSIIRNESFILPYFLRHYGQFAEKIFLIDGGSTDSTLDIARKNEKVTLLNLDNDGIDDELFARVYSEAPRIISKEADWVICVDADEFVHGSIGLLDPDCENYRRMYDSDVITPQGWQMISDKLPDGAGQIYDYVKEGVRDRMIDKPCIWKPSVHLTFGHGRHSCRTEATCCESEFLKLLHYRFLSRNYVRNRSEWNYKRLSENNLRVGSGIHNRPDWEGYQSMQWYEKALREKVQCID